MNLTKSETWLVVILSCITCLALSVAIYMLSRVPGDHEQLLSAVHDNGERLGKLEQMKSPATTRRFTANDGETMIRCLRLPYDQRGPCLDILNQRIADRP